MIRPSYQLQVRSSLCLIHSDQAHRRQPTKRLIYIFFRNIFQRKAASLDYLCSSVVSAEVVTGYNQSIKQKHKTVDITGIIEEISSVKGIGATKLADIKAILEKHLEVRADA